MAHETLQVGDLTAVIGDNEGYGSHAAGYNNSAPSGTTTKVRSSTETIGST